MKIGYIGLGALGGALSRRFLGHDLTVWDLNPAACAALAAEGAKVAATAAELGRECDVVLTCLPRSRDVAALMFGEGGLAEGLSAGKLVIDQTSGVPGETRDIARRLAEQGVDMIDASVSASPHLVSQGAATLMLAGPDEVCQRALPVLHVITQAIHRCGTRVGDGQAMKMVNNAINCACRVGTLEVVALGRKLGLSLESMRDVFGVSSAQNITAVRMLPAIAEGKQSTNFALALMLKDVNQAVALGTDQGVPMPVSNTVRSMVQVGVNTLGPKAMLEDVIGLVETMAATRFVAPGSQAPAPAPDPAADAPRTVCVVGAAKAAAMAETLAAHFDVRFVSEAEASDIGLKAAADGREVVILALSDPQAAADLLRGVDGIAAGTVVVAMSEAAPQDAVAIAAHLQSQHGIAVVDASNCSVPGVSQAGAIACGGDARAFGQALPVLRLLAEKVVYCGPPGSGAMVGVLNTAATGLCAAVTAECVTTGHRYGLTYADMATVLSVCSGWSAAGKAMLPRIAAGARSQEPAFGAISAAFRHFTVLGIEQGAPTLVAHAARAAFEAEANRVGAAAGLDEIFGYFDAAA